MNIPAHNIYIHNYQTVRNKRPNIHNYPNTHWYHEYPMYIIFIYIYIYLYTLYTIHQKSTKNIRILTYPLVNWYNHGRSSFWMGKSTISMAIFSS